MNPFLEKSSLPYGAFDFKSLKNEHYLPALHHHIEEAKLKIESIKKEAIPSFSNIIIKLEEVGKEINLVASVFNYLLGANTNEELQRLAEEISGTMVNYANDVLLDSELFQKIKN